jgi:hypothetical protein
MHDDDIDRILLAVAEEDPAAVPALIRPGS